MLATSSVSPNSEKRSAESLGLTVADSVWIATATLHCEHPEKDRVGAGNLMAGFSAEEILERVMSLHLTGAAENSIRQHINQHCVSNRAPQPNKSCELFALGRGWRRLYREGDLVAEGRDSKRCKPSKLPAEFLHLHAWYDEWWGKHGGNEKEEDPLLGAIGRFKHIWAGVDTDQYVAALREGWEDDAR